MRDRGVSGGTIVWLIFFVLLPCLYVAGLLIGSRNSERWIMEQSKRGEELLQQWEQQKAQVTNTITISNSTVNVASRISPTSVAGYICRYRDSDIPHDFDYYVHFRTEDSVTFTNNSDKTPALIRVGLSAAGQPWKVKVPNRSFPDNIWTKTSDTWRFLGTLTIGQQTEALARQKYEELTADLVTLIWEFTLDSGTTITLETRLRQPPVMGTAIADCGDLSIVLYK